MLPSRPAWFGLGLGLLAALLSAGPRAASAEEEAPEIPELPEVVVRPPRTYAGPGETGSDVTVTPLRRAARGFDVPSAVTVEDGAWIRRRRMARSVPDALLRLPGVMVQKTAPMQASPFIRGFTGYRNLVLIDGIRFNNSAFRSGPNQYWSTIDSYTIQRLELTRGPLAVLYGSDAVGGTVNVVPLRRESFEPGFHVDGLFSTRAAEAEQSWFSRFQLEGNAGKVGWIGGLTWKTLGDITSGGGRLPATGGITEMDGDLRFDVALDRRWSLAFAYQHVGQDDAPRVHKTVDAVPFRGTTVGSELSRDYDQVRDLAYARLRYDDPCGCGPIESALLGVSWQRMWEQRDRRRTGDRQDLSGFELDQLGVQAQLVSPSRVGTWTYGVDYYQDRADTWQRDYVGGVLAADRIQGPFGDDSRYDLFGAFVQDELTFGRFDLVMGARFTYASARANRVEDPASPGDVIQVAGDWTNVVGHVRGVYHASPAWNVYGGVGQAFRAPTLYDLTSFETTSVVELPSPGLAAEKFLTFELGTKTEQENVTGYAAVWYTLLDDTIVRSPTGEVLDDTPVVRKDNVGDGWVWGWEVEATGRIGRGWLPFGNLSWMNGQADEIDPATNRLVRSPLSRLQPLTLLLGLRYEPSTSRGWGQVEVSWSDRAARPSLRDRTDTSRIPPEGTPGWTVVNLRGGWRIDDHVSAGLSIENLLDANYRIHGSGQNEPGLNVVFTLDVEM